MKHPSVIETSSNGITITQSVLPGEIAIFSKRLGQDVFCPTSIIIEGEQIHELLISDFYIGDTKLIGVWISANIINGFERIFANRLATLQVTAGDCIKFTLRTSASSERRLIMKIEGKFL